LPRPELSPDLVSPFLALPGLRGFWPMSSFNEAGNAYDMSEQGRTLTYNGNPTYNYDGVAPYIDLDGTGDFLTRGDEAGLDILGTETYVAAAVRGLTLGCWAYFNNVAVAAECIMTKGDGLVAATAYWLDRGALGNARFIISDGAAFQIAGGAIALQQDTWYFLVGRFEPSTEAAIFVNSVQVGSDVAGIPAVLLNVGANFDIGSYNNGTGLLMTGRVSLAFLCTSLLSEAIISSLFQQTRAAFRV